MLLVREPVPARQISLRANDGSRYRWALDDPDPSRLPAGVNYGTSMPGGEDTFSCTLPRDPQVSYPDLEIFSHAEVQRDAGKKLVYEVSHNGGVSGSERSISVEGTGIRTGLEDREDVRALFADAGFSKWTGPSSKRKLNLLNANWTITEPSNDVDPKTGLPAIYQELDEQWTSPFTPINEAWYDSEGLGIGYLHIEIRTPWFGSAWHKYVYSASDMDTPVTQVTDWSAQSLTGGYHAINNYCALLEFLFSVTNGGALGSNYYVNWTKPRVYGQHGLTRYGADPGGFYTGQMIKWLIQHKTQLAVGDIDLGTLLHSHAAYYDPGTALDIVENLSRYEPWYEWHTYGEKFNFQKRGTFGSKWRASVKDAELQTVGQTSERMWNEIVVRVEDPLYGTVLIGPTGSEYATQSSYLRDTDPRHPANRAGKVRRAVLDVGESTTDLAPLVGKKFLSELKKLDNSGEATLTGYVENQSGIPYPADEVVGGDYISFYDSSDPTFRHVTSTNVSEEEASNSISLDSEPTTIEAILARLQASLIPLG